jgi:hypothetical protein
MIGSSMSHFQRLPRYPIACTVESDGLADHDAPHHILVQRGLLPGFNSRCSHHTPYAIPRENGTFAFSITPFELFPQFNNSQSGANIKAPNSLLEKATQVTIMSWPRTQLQEKLKTSLNVSEREPSHTCRYNGKDVSSMFVELQRARPSILV